MDAGKLPREMKRDRRISQEDKFELVSCSVKGVHCRGILPEINELYARSESARIDKEYQRSAELLQKAYAKTLLLDKPVCAQCVNFFQTSITETMEQMEEEVHDMSVGFFHKKRYEHVYLRLRNFLKKMRSFKLGDSGNFLTKETTPVGIDW